MRDPLSHDDIEELEATAHGAAAQILPGWAEKQHPDDDDAPAAFIAAAAWHLDRAGDRAAACRPAGRR